jgi:hypothetical protein
VKRIYDVQSVLPVAPLLFYGYRWLAWLLACLSFALPGPATQSWSSAVALLVLTLVLNLVATAAASAYIRIATQRPSVLALDLAAGITLVWLSGSGVLPFLPYALGALIVPALLFSWRGALVAGLAFGSADLIGYLLLQDASLVGADGLVLLTIRFLVPSVFGLGVVAIVRYVAQDDGEDAQMEPVGSWRSDGSLPETAIDAVAPVVRIVDRTVARRSESVSFASLSAPLRPAVTRTVPVRSVDPDRRMIYERTPRVDLPLPELFERMTLQLADVIAPELQVRTIGPVAALSVAQQQVLLRVAQEALLNVHQHAQAHHVLLSLIYETATVALVVQDDGVGLLDGTCERPGVHGLRVIRYRLAELDGQLHVSEGESGGVTLRATLPLSH